MTVQELITALEKCDPDFQVVTVVASGKVHRTVVQVEEPTYNKQVVLVSYKE